MAISSEQSLSAHAVASFPFDVAGRMPPWHPTSIFWLRRLSIALALVLVALVYFITPLLMRDSAPMRVTGSAQIDNRCAASSPGQKGSVGTGVCLLTVQFVQGSAAHVARLQQETPFPTDLTNLLVVYHQRSLLGFPSLGHLVVTSITAPGGLVLSSQGAEIIADAQTQIPAGLPQGMALALLFAGVFTFFFPWPVWKVRVNAEVLAMRQVEVRNAQQMIVRRSLVTLGWHTNKPMQHEVAIPGRLYRRLCPGDHAILTYEHLRSGAFKALRVHLPSNYQGWLASGVMQIGALTPWRWRWLLVSLLWLEIPLSLFLLTQVS